MKIPNEFSAAISLTHHTEQFLGIAGCDGETQTQDFEMNRIIYIVGLVVIVIAILSFIGLA